MTNLRFFQCDGISLNLADGPALQGISLLNIPSTHGGTNMWGDSKARRMKKNSGGSSGSGSVKKQLKKKKNQKEREVNSISSITDIDLSSAVQGDYQ